MPTVLSAEAKSMVRITLSFVLTWSVNPFTTKSHGDTNCADAPGPLSVATVPSPAAVVTARVRVSTARILWLAWSATYRVVPSRASPWGLLNLAAAPVPSAYPDCPVLLVGSPPASVVTAAGVMLISTALMAWLVGV